MDRGRRRHSRATRHFSQEAEAREGTLNPVLYLSGTVGDRFQVWPLEAPLTGLGRSSRNAVQLVDATVSKDHAEIVRTGDKWQIRDLGSRNGTRVNGAEAREPVTLSPGDRIEIG